MPSLSYARQFIHPEDFSKIGEEIQKAVKLNDASYSSQFEHRVIYNNGETGLYTRKTFYH